MKLFYFPLMFLFLAQLSACGQDSFSANKEEFRNLWLSPDRKIVMAIDWCDTGLCGKIVGLRPPRGSSGALLLDVKNETPAMRVQPVCGMKVFRNLHWNPKRYAWEGHIYYPQTGKRYPVRITAGRTGQLLVRTDLQGPRFFGLQWLSETDTWTVFRGETKDDCTILEKFK